MSACTFCGHHDASLDLLPLLQTAIESLITGKRVSRFYVGNHGNFDSMALSALREAKRNHPHISYFVVLAYMPVEKDAFPIYGDAETLFPAGLETAPRRFAITYRNRWMVGQSDFLIAYVRRSFGGAAQTLNYAKNRLTIINLA
ncbi:MAG: hypothetical protein Q4C04_08070 [Clostridia bacterium]|nr:hypothetical protein [Clostridia bacterium]